MECVDVERRLSALLDGELEDAHEVEHHLVACESCRRKRMLLAAVKGAVQRLPVETVSDRFTAAFRQRIDAERQPQGAHRRSWNRSSFVLGGVLAATLVLGLWTSTRLPSRARPVSPPFGGVMTPEAWPGLDCGLELREPQTEGERPCASAAACGPMRVRPDTLSRRRPVCIKG